jgi:hypothetical protein
MKVEGGKHGLKSSWQGYRWKLEEPADADLSMLNNLETLKIKQYKFTVARLEKNGKTLISFSGKEIDNGEWKVKYEFPVVF